MRYSAADAKYCGATETIIGNYLAKHPDARAKLVIATKVAGPMPSAFVAAARGKSLRGANDENAPLPRLIPEQIRDALNASLVRLKTGAQGVCNTPYRAALLTGWRTQA